MMVCDLTFSNGEGPLRASGTNVWELLRSVGKETARDNGIYITEVTWIHTHPVKPKEQTKEPRVGPKEALRLKRAQEAWFK